MYVAAAWLRGCQCVPAAERGGVPVLHVMHTYGSSAKAVLCVFAAAWLCGCECFAAAEGAVCQEPPAMEGVAAGAEVGAEGSKTGR